MRRDLVPALVLATLAVVAAGAGATLQATEDDGSESPLEDRLRPAPDLPPVDAPRPSLPVHLDQPLVETQGPSNRTLLQVPPDVAAKVEADLLDVGKLVHEELVGADGSVPVVVRGDASLVAGLLEDPQPHPPLSLTAGEVPLDEIEALARAPAVERVFLDDRLDWMLHRSVDRVEANHVHNRTTEAGASVTGHGVSIAVIDTGVDYTHPRLGGCFGSGCKVAEGDDFVEDDADPMDTVGHGTHVAATAAGERGVAPNATIHAYRVCETTGCPLSAILAAIENATERGADVISMSLGGPGTTDGPLASAADWAVEQGVVVVSSAGNAGPGNRTVGEPAASLKGIAVGASDQQGGIASFSSRGPVVDSRGTVQGVKPDVAAPGVDVDAAVPTGDCLLCDPAGELSLDGTSMAALHVSGTAALLLQAHPSWTPADVKGALANPADDLGRDSLVQGAGLVDALASWNSTLAVVEPNAWLGIDPTGQQTYRSNETVEVRNLVDRAQDVSLGVSTSQGAIDARLNTSTVALDAGGTGNVTVNLTVDNPELPDDWWEAAITAEGDEQTRSSLVSFRKSGVIHLDLDRDTFVVEIARNGSWYRLLVRPPSGVSLLAPDGTYDLASWIFGCPSGEDCRYSLEIAEDIHHENETNVSLETGPEMHRIDYRAHDRHGTPLDRDEMGDCRRGPELEDCFAQSYEEFRAHGPPLGFLVLDTGDNRPVFVGEDGRNWTYGRHLAYRSNGSVFMTANASTGIPSNLALETTPLTSWDVRYNLPAGVDQASRTAECFGLRWRHSPDDPGEAFHIVPRFYTDFGATTRPVEDDSEERFFYGGPQLDPIRLGDRWESPLPCERVAQDLSIGQDTPEDRCKDPSGCVPFARSHFQEPTGEEVVQYETGSFFHSVDAPFDDRFARPDGDIVLGDGAPTFEGRVEAEGRQVKLRSSPLTAAFFEPAGGYEHDFNVHPDGFGLDLREDVRYQLYNRGELLHERVFEAPGPEDNPVVRFEETTVPQEGPVRVNVTYDDAVLDGRNGTVRYEVNYETEPRRRTAPFIEWIRVTGDGELGTDFLATDDVSLHFRVSTLSSTSQIDVTVDGPTGPVTYPIVSPEDGVHSVDLVEMGPGSYDVTVEVVSQAGMETRLIQQPAFALSNPIDTDALRDFLLGRVPTGQDGPTPPGPGPSGTDEPVPLHPRKAPPRARTR